jgi:hypothetical protein
MLAFALLVLQAIIPWTARYFVTQDGPSHLYTAVVARELLLNRHSPYAPIYMLQPKMVTNWGAVALLNGAAVLVGVDHAEQALATLCVVTGFFGFSYFCYALNPGASPWSPVTNFLLNTLFLWLGFYNFYFAMALCPLVVAFYIRHARALTWGRGAVLAVALLGLWFMHLIALGLALVAIILNALWIHIVEPTSGAEAWTSVIGILRRAVLPLSVTMAAVIPVVVLSAIFARASGEDKIFDFSVKLALDNFPTHVFASSRGRVGEQAFLVPAMLFFMAIGVLLMRRREWAGARGAIAVTAALTFGLYLIVPDSAFGAGAIKIRFSWALFVFGCLLALCVRRMQALRTPVAIYITCFLTATLLHQARHNVRNAGCAAAAYAAVLGQVPAGATLVRLRYPTEKTSVRFGYDDIVPDPLYHADSWVAARRRFLALSDYQAISQVFPVAFRPIVPDLKRTQLWDLEGVAPNAFASLKAVLEGFPAAIDYVVVLGDDTPEKAGEVAQVLSHLGSSMTLAGENSFVHLYKRSGAR